MNRSRDIWLAGLGVVLLAAASGCLPEKRVTWSPDGTRAAILGGNWNLYFCDVAGKLSERLAEGVHEVAWLPDSKRLLMVQERPLKSWAEITAVLDAEYARRLAVVGEQLYAEVLAHEGSFENFEPQSLRDLTDEEKAAGLVYECDRHADTLRQKVGEEWNKLNDVVATLQVLAVVEAGGPALGRRTELTHALNTISAICLTPDGRTAAYIGGPALPELSAEESASAVPERRWAYVGPTEGGAAPRVVVRRGVLSLDWTTDGRYVAYAAGTTQAVDDSDPQLGVVGRVEVRNSSGALLAEFPQADEMAGVLFQSKESVRVRCLPDGRILFASAEVTLPCTAADMPQRFSLFAIDPQRAPTVSRLTPRQVEEHLPDAVFLFEPSPDGRYVCVPGLNGRVTVLTLATGEVWDAVGENEIDNLRTVPTWRTNDELCFVTVPGEEGAKKRPELALQRVRWADEKSMPRIISRDWPDAVAVQLLISEDEATRRKEEATRGASQPGAGNP